MCLLDLFIPLYEEKLICFVGKSFYLNQLKTVELKLFINL